METSKSQIDRFVNGKCYETIWNAVSSDAKDSSEIIDKLMPPVSRLGGGNRAKKKQTIIDKLKAFFEKYSGVGRSFKSDEDIKIME